MLPVTAIQREVRQPLRVETVLVQETAVQCSVAVDGLDDSGQLASPRDRVDDYLIVSERSVSCLPDAAPLQLEADILRTP